MVAVLDPTALTGFRHGLFSVSAQDDRVYLVTSDGAVPAAGSRVLTTLTDEQLSPVGADWFGSDGMILDPASPVAVGETGFDGRMMGAFHGESRKMLLDAGAGLVTVPGLMLADFMGGTLPAGVTLTRASVGRHTNSSGVLSSAAIDAARFDFDPVTLVLRGLLIEPARTNLLLRSDSFNNASWIKSSRISVTGDAIVAPTGATTADDAYVNNVASAGHAISQNNAFTSGLAYAFSGMGKAGETKKLRLWLNSAAFGSEREGIFDLENGAVISATAAAYGMEYLGADWWRCWVGDTASATATTAANFGLINAANAYTYAGVLNDGLGLFGAQLEAAPSPSSLIDTAAATAARSAEVVSLTVPSGIGTLVHTFDDGSTQNVAVSPGAYTVPTNLNRSIIQTIRGTI